MGAPGAGRGGSGKGRARRAAGSGVGGAAPNALRGQAVCTGTRRRRRRGAGTARRLRAWSEPTSGRGRQYLPSVRQRGIAALAHVRGLCPCERLGIVERAPYGSFARFSPTRLPVAAIQKRFGGVELRRHSASAHRCGRGARVKRALFGSPVHAFVRSHIVSVRFQSASFRGAACARVVTFPPRSRGRAPVRAPGR